MDRNLLHQTSLSLILYSMTWLVATSVSGTGIQGGGTVWPFSANDVVERSSYARGNFGRWDRGSARSESASDRKSASTPRTCW